jgi:PIN domain nuclease of toxin-antitoxin system
LADDARVAVADTRNEVLVSAASTWEISIKRAAGRLEAPFDITGWIQAQGFRTLSMTVEHGVAAGGLPPHHRDPFDRMLIAQAQLEGLTIVTRDKAFDLYDVPVLPA